LKTKKADSNLSPLLQEASDLLAEFEFRDQFRVAIWIRAAKISQKLFALADHVDQTLAAVVIFFVRFEVLSERLDVESQKRDLHFRTSGVHRGTLKFFDNLFFLVREKCHLSSDNIFKGAPP
jgi:hypothetical protein